MAYLAIACVTRMTSAGWASAIRSVAGPPVAGAEGTTAERTLGRACGAAGTLFGHCRGWSWASILEKGLRRRTVHGCPTKGDERRRDKVSPVRWNSELVNKINFGVLWDRLQGRRRAAHGSSWRSGYDGPVVRECVKVDIGHISHPSLIQNDTGLQGTAQSRPPHPVWLASDALGPGRGTTHGKCGLMANWA